jgi:hypothetical protein
MDLWNTAHRIDFAVFRLANNPSSRIDRTSRTAIPDSGQRT